MEVKEQEKIHKEENRIVAVAFILMALLTIGMFALEAGTWEPPARCWLMMGILTDEVGIIIILVVLYHRIAGYQKEKLEAQYCKEREQECLEGMMDLYQVGREINHWRHDMLGELAVLHRMLKNGKYGDVEECIEKMYNSLQDYLELPQSTGNEGLDAALIKAISRCRKLHISFRYMVLGRTERMDSMDLGILMDNLLSNGIESCQNTACEREIDLAIQDMGTGMEIYLTNSIAESVLKNNAELRSYKKERMRHGFGMESIRNIVKKYSGIYECWEEDTYFCQRIFLNYKSK